MTSTIPAISNETLTSLNAGVQPVSQRIRQRLVDQGISFLANDNVAAFIETGELDELELEVADRVRELLRSLVIDIDNDHNTAETAERVARMYLREVFKGRYNHQPKVASFPNVKQLDEIYTVGPISVRSACSPHLVPWLSVNHHHRQRTRLLTRLNFFVSH